MNVAPSYLCDLITLFSDTLTIENRPRLCSSSDTTKLLVPRSRKRAGDHSFCCRRSEALEWVANSVERGGICACLQRVAESTFVSMLAVCLYFCLASFLPIIFVRRCVLCRTPYKCWLLLLLLLLLLMLVSSFSQYFKMFRSKNNIWEIHVYVI